MQNNYALISILNAHVNDIYIQLLIINDSNFLYFLLLDINSCYRLSISITVYRFGYNKLLPCL